MSKDTVRGALKKLTYVYSARFGVYAESDIDDCLSQLAEVVGKLIKPEILVNSRRKNRAYNQAISDVLNLFKPEEGDKSSLPSESEMGR